MNSLIISSLITVIVLSYIFYPLLVDKESNIKKTNWDD
jgi:hypothetical protein